MHTIKLEKNKRLVVTRRKNIYVNEENAESLLFLLPTRYGGIALSECSIMINYVLPSGSMDMLILSPEEKLYKGYLQYIFPMKGKLTAQPGEIHLWLTIANSFDVALIKSSVLRIEILDHCMEPEDPACLEGIAMQIDKLMKTKADNLHLENGELGLLAEGKPVGSKVEINSGGLILFGEQEEAID